MYKLTCPHCETMNEVSTAKAGGQITCAACDGGIDVPKLGELRKLPAAGQTSQAKADANASAGLSGTRSLAFMTLSLVCLLSFLGTLFCGVNWATTEVPMTTEKHLDLLRDQYAQASSAQLIREYEDITRFGVDIPNPLVYRTVELERDAWKHKTIAFALLSVTALVLAIIVGWQRRAQTVPG